MKKKTDNNEDIVKMNSDTILTDKNGKIIHIVVPPPEYVKML